MLGWAAELQCASDRVTATEYLSRRGDSGCSADNGLKRSLTNRGVSVSLNSRFEVPNLGLTDA